VRTHEPLGAIVIQDRQGALLELFSCVGVFRQDSIGILI
jgi:hypothetical protein